MSESDADYLKKDKIRSKEMFEEFAKKMKKKREVDFQFKNMDEELAQNTTSDRHVYEFYRLDDRRVMVRLYQIDSDGNMTTEAVSDFYVSLLAFKKIVGNSFALLNAQTLNQDVAYPYLSK